MPGQDFDLSSSEIDVIHSTWTPFAQDLQNTGIIFFLSFFKRKPCYQNAFPFRNVPWHELTQNESFQKHALAVMKSIDSVINSIQDTSTVFKLLENNGKSHGIKNIGLTWAHYEYLEDTLLEVVDQYYRDQSKPIGLNEKKVWAKFLRAITSNIYKAVLRHQKT